MTIKDPAEKPPEGNDEKSTLASAYKRLVDKIRGNKDGNSWKMKLDSKWRDVMNQANSMGSQTADVLLTLSQLRNKPRKSDYVAAAMKLGNVAMNFVEFEEPPHRDPLAEYMEKLGHEYSNLSDETFCGETIMEILKREFATRIQTLYYEEDKQGNSYYIYAIDLDGDEILWADGASMDIDGPWVRSERMEIAFHRIGEFIWKRIGSNHCQAMEDKDDNFRFVADDLADKTLPSEIADQAVVRIMKYLNHPEVGPTITRALLFYGRQGTGKSTCVRAIAQGLNMRSLRISFFAIDEEVSTTLIPSLKILRPQVLIIDDIDRSYDQELLLEQLETFRSKVRVILATANYPQQIDRAVLRPGRFDEAIKLEKLDADVIGELIGKEVPLDYRTKLGEMPIAYINEFSLCRKVLGDKEAFDRIEELHARVELGCEPNLQRKRR